MLGFVAVLFASVVCIPNALALGTVQDITNQDTVHGSENKPTVTINPSDNTKVDKVTITYSKVNVKELGATSDTGGNGTRPAGYAWVGFSLTPEKANESDRYRVTYYNDKEGKEETTGWEKLETNNKYYSGINAARLEYATKKGTPLTFVYEFSYNNSEPKTDQTITVIINPADVTLYGTDDNQVEWNEAKYEEVKEAAEAAKAKQEATKDDNALDNVPKTGSSLPIALIGLLGLATLTGAYSLRLAYTRK